MPKCPECGKNHRTNWSARKCLMDATYSYHHMIILYHGRDMDPEIKIRFEKEKERAERFRNYELSLPEYVVKC